MQLSQKRLEIEQNRRNLRMMDHMYCQCSQQNIFQHFENLKNLKKNQKFRKKFKILILLKILRNCIDLGQFRTFRKFQIF